MRDALERLDTLYPGMMLKFGGHAMAAGLSLEEDKFKTLSTTVLANGY
ncbi:single-stranded DNA-specific exonuclease [Escherichia coli]|uniref:Single-stranded DNA-specific exonuclease n=1 Tax=Escherichia coli TaxID=562 RepID=A0A2X1NAC7_ECOLX|nr:single-stranded DNA-specific exonuclease [Escherichia coli]